MRLTLCFLFASLLSFFSLNANAADVALPPAADLDAQIDYYLGEFDKSLEDLAASKDFAADSQVLVRDANAVTLIALALGMSEEDGKYKAAAPEIIAAAHAIVEVKDTAAAKTAVANLKAAVTKKSTDKLEWKKVAQMSPTMKLTVPRINTSMGRYVRNERTLDRGIENIAGGTATLASIAQGLTSNYDETSKPEKKDEWIKLSHDFRDAALKANAAVHGYEKKTVTFDDFKAAFSEMKASCEHCHAVFVEGNVTLD